MKRLITLLLTAGMILGGAASSKAIELRATGTWQFGWSWQDTDLQRHGDSSDTFQARTRIRPQFEFIASENLQGILQFEIGRNRGTGNAGWGAEHGWAIGTDGNNVKTRFAYLDWMVPEVNTHVRMGLQYAETPSFTFHTVMGVEMAGVALSQSINDWLGVSLAWFRPYNDYSLPHDSIDVTLLSLPVTGDGFRVTPWAMSAFVGKNAFEGIDTHNAADALTGSTSWGAESTALNSLLPADYAPSGLPGNHPFGWWLGVGGEMTLFDPFTLAADFVYGHFDAGHRADGYNVQRSGWIASLLATYKLDYMTPGIIAWYASGDDRSWKNGSERLPAIYADSWATNFGSDGGWYDAGCLTLDLSGSWGLGLRLDDITFIDKLSHNVRATYYQGTNNANMVKKGAVSSPLFPGRSNGFYLTTSDRAYEFNIENSYQIYKNLTAAFELGYVYLDLDKGVWSGTKDQLKNHMYKVGAYLTYKY